MSKCIIILISAFMFGVTSFAQSCELYGRIAIYGGYNFFTKQQVSGLSALGNVDRLCVKLEMGCTQIPLPEYGETLSHFYVSPSVGVLLDKKHDVYAMIGFIPWVGYTEIDGSRVLSDDVSRPKVEVGIYLPLKSIILLNVEVAYMWPSSFDERKCQNLTLRMGVAVNL
ncbi:MAG: hypothetical protein J5896_05140 [Alphaproteobacteria bacterium]|nr:hypothetical protein [Alphaproteobacteria bacterium]